MIEILQEQILLTATARAMLRRAVDDVLDGNCHLIVHPAAMAACPLLQAILSELDKRRLNVRELNAVELEGRNPAFDLLRHFQVDAPGNHDPVATLLRNCERIDVFHVDGLTQLDPSSQRRWREFAVLWGRTCQRLRGGGEHAGVLFGSLGVHDGPLLEDLRGDAGFTVAWWCGVPANVEMRLLCRELENGQPRGPDAEWREHLAASLAGSDARFLVEVWPFLLDSPESILNVARQYSASRGWNCDQFQNLLKQAHVELASARGALSGEYDSLEPPPRLRSLWNHELVTYSLEHGYELHTAALAMLNDASAKTALLSRLWRGQAGLILPRLDVVRLDACRHLTARHGRGWTKRWRVPDSEDERNELVGNPNVCQWGYMLHLLRSVKELKGERELRDIATDACALRNELSHCRPVAFSLFDQFRRKAARLAT